MRKSHEPHHTAPQFCGVIYAVFILRGAVTVYKFSQTASAGCFAVLGKNRIARATNTHDNPIYLSLYLIVMLYVYIIFISIFIFIFK